MTPPDHAIQPGDIVQFITATDAPRLYGKVTAAFYDRLGVMPLESPAPRHIIRATQVVEHYPRANRHLPRPLQVVA